MVASKSVLGANEKIQLAGISMSTRGTDNMGRFIANQDCAIVALCDVAKSKLEAAAKDRGGKVATYDDYRRVLHRKDVDTILIATPDHWRSPIAVGALAARRRRNSAPADSACHAWRAAQREWAGRSVEVLASASASDATSRRVRAAVSAAPLRAPCAPGRSLAPHCCGSRARPRGGAMFHVNELTRYRNERRVGLSSARFSRERLPTPRARLTSARRGLPARDRAEEDAGVDLPR